MNTSFTGATTTIGTACTNYAGGQVTIVVPSSGRVMVQAQVFVWINHASGTRDTAIINIGDTGTDCIGGANQWPVDIPAVSPTYSAYFGAFPQRSFPVTAGTHTFFLNGYMTSGQDASDVFYWANMVAVFYPS